MEEQPNPLAGCLLLILLMLLAWNLLLGLILIANS